MTFEKPRVEGHAIQHRSTGHARRGSSVSELHGIADFTVERSPACVAPSPEQKVTFKMVGIRVFFFGSSRSYMPVLILFLGVVSLSVIQ